MSLRPNGRMRMPDLKTLLSKRRQADRHAHDEMAATLYALSQITGFPIKKLNG